MCSGLIWVVAASALIRGRLKWSGKYEAHLWDNTSQVKGRKRKGKHGMHSTNLEPDLSLTVKSSEYFRLQHCYGLVRNANAMCTRLSLERNCMRRLYATPSHNTLPCDTL